MKTKTTTTNTKDVHAMVLALEDAKFPVKKSADDFKLTLIQQFTGDRVCVFNATRIAPDVWEVTHHDRLFS